jgi:hypothetical protein
VSPGATVNLYTYDELIEEVSVRKKQKKKEMLAAWMGWTCGKRVLGDP